MSLIPALLGPASGNSGCFRWCDCLEHRPWSLISRYPAPPVALTTFPPCKVRSSPKCANGAPTTDISVRREAVGWWADSGDRASWLGRLGSLGAVGVGYTTRSADCLGAFSAPRPSEWPGFVGAVPPLPMRTHGRTWWILECWGYRYSDCCQKRAPLCAVFDIELGRCALLPRVWGGCRRSREAY